MSRLAAGVVAWSLLVGPPGCSPNVVRYGELQEDAVEDVVRGISAVRELPPVRPIGFRLVGADRLRKDFAADLGRDASTGQMSRRRRYWATLGLVPWELDLQDHYEDLYERLPAGYYEDEKQGVRVVFRNTIRSEVMEIASLVTGRDKTYGETLAHEVVHALQDQHFGLERMQSVDGTDRRNARRALVEGDAFLAAFQHDRPILFRDVHQFVRLVRRTFQPASGSRASYLEATFLFPYVYGTRFVAAVFERGGWAAVNAVYADPPETTAEILHPERYLDRWPAPAPHDLEAVRGALAGTWIPMVEEAVGELALRFLVDEALEDPRAAEEIGAGWRGDRALVLDRVGGGGTALVWTSRWRDAEVAERFAAAYEKRMEGLRREGVTVARHGQVVLVTAGLSAEEAARVVPLALAGTGVMRPTPPHRRAATPAPPSEAPSAEQPVRIDPPLAVGGYVDGPLFVYRSAQASLALDGIVQYRVDADTNTDPALGSDPRGSHGMPRATLGLSGTVEPVLQLGFRLSAELSPSPDEPTLSGPRPETFGVSVLQDASVRMRLASVGLADAGAFGFGRAPVPLLLEGLTPATELALADRAMPYDTGMGHLVPVRDLGFTYDVDYVAHGVPLGFAISLGQAVQGGRISLLGPRNAAPGPRLEGGVTLFARRPVRAADPARSFSALGADLMARWRGVRLEGTLLSVDPTGDEQGWAWSALAAVQPLPDFLELAARYDRMDLPTDLLPFAQRSRLTWGVAMHYLAGRFRIALDQVREMSAYWGDPQRRTSRLLVSLGF